MSATNPVEKEATAVNAAAEALRVAVKAHEEAVQKKREKIEEDRKAELDQQDAVAHAMQIAQQLSQTKVNDYDEQLSRLNPVVVAPAPSPETTAPSVTPPAQPVEVIAPATEPATLAVVQPVTPEPQHAIGMPDAQVVPLKIQRNPSYSFNPRKWNGKQLGIAVLAGLVGLVIGWTVIGLPSWAQAVPLELKWLFSTFWVAVFVVVFFFGGAWTTCAVILRRKKKELQEHPSAA